MITAPPPLHETKMKENLVKAGGNQHSLVNMIIHLITLQKYKLLITDCSS